MTTTPFLPPTEPNPSATSVPGSTPRMRGRTPIDRDSLVLSVLIPVYNERDTIELILSQVHAVPVRKEIICVNDFSTDGTREILDRLHAEGRIHKLIHQPRNMGKGAAVLRGMIGDFTPRWYIAYAHQSIESAEILAADSVPLLRYAGSIATARVYEPVAK